MSRFRYLSRSEIIYYHAAEFRRRGSEPAPVISEEKLEAALARPKASAFGEPAYPTLSTKAAAYLESFAIGHPFLDGNKRAALAAVLAFLELNGADRVVDPDSIADLVLAVAKGALKGNEAIAARLRELYAPNLDGR